MTRYFRPDSFRRLSPALLLVCAQLTSAESLLDIYERALNNDAQLRSQAAQYRANIEQENLTLAPLLPQVTAGYEFSNNDTDSTRQSFIGDGNGGIVLGEISQQVDVDTDGYDVRLSQTLFDLSAWYNYQAGKEFTLQAEATFAANTQNLIVRVVEAYVGVLRAQDNLAAAESQERAFQRQLEQTQQRFDVGLIAITDVYEAEAARDLSEVTRIVEENNVAVAKERLSVLTGEYHERLNVLTPDFTARTPEPADRASWVDFALENNFELAAARFAEESARQTAKANKMEHAPKVTAGYTYADNETEGSLATDPPALVPQPQQEQTAKTWQVRVDMPLFTGGSISANRRRAAEQFNAAREDRINLTRTTVTEARSLHMTVMSDVARVKARKQSIKSAQSALDATEAGYEVGTRNIVDVLNAQNILFEARRDYANTRYDYIINSLRLKETAGTLARQDLERLDSFLVEPAAPTASGSTQSE
ncbi:type I secretion outer membrane protein, TolC [Luminiphilus syltensis NOR5-1B]|uniref:Type I secretion outer membrane protein, TolC n=1 Tax=Luminiphilus syltensis NOR5-1B TaxID=565045 RepID=B8KUL9_9GAMM|nr:TolC family outer membrane protein [Luminiphilus syltensis]EED35229.1 type I secretion outer membrane protein, TolC [Luminiphilus syltensis NOR5-1B]